MGVVIFERLEKLGVIFQDLLDEFVLVFQFAPMARLTNFLSGFALPEQSHVVGPQGVGVFFDLDAAVVLHSGGK